jgi:hypothetical protein
MRTRRITTINTTALYLIALVVIIVAFILLGGGHWAQGMMHGSRSMGAASWNWAQILVSAGIGFLLGYLAARRKF